MLKERFQSSHDQVYLDCYVALGIVLFVIRRMSAGLIVDILLRLKDAGNISDELSLLPQLVQELSPPSALLVDMLCQEKLDLFVQHVFERRFGWSELVVTVSATQKKRINDYLDAILNVILQQPLSRPLVLAFISVTSATNKPVSRSQGYLHFFSWFLQACEQHASSSEIPALFDVIKVLMQYIEHC